MKAMKTASATTAATPARTSFCHSIGRLKRSILPRASYPFLMRWSVKYL